MKNCFKPVSSSHSSGSPAPYLQLPVTAAGHDEVPLQVQAPDRALQVSSPGRKRRRFVKARERFVPQAPPAAAAASLLVAAAQGAGPSLGVRGGQAGEADAVGGAVLFVHFANQAAEVVASFFLAPAHSPEPRLRFGHLHLLGEVGVDEGGEVWLVAEKGRLGRAEHPLELVAALKGVVQAVLAIRAVIPALLVIKNAAAVPSQPGRQHQGVSAPVLTESEGLGWAQGCHSHKDSKN